MASTKAAFGAYRYAHLEDALAKLEREFKSAKGVERETIRRWIALVLEALLKQDGPPLHRSPQARRGTPVRQREGVRC
jgi:hypothetical protein